MNQSTSSQISVVPFILSFHPTSYASQSGRSISEWKLKQYTGCGPPSARSANLIIWVSEIENYGAGDKGFPFYPDDAFAAHPIPDFKSWNRI